MKKFNIILFLFACILFFSYTFAQVNLNPVYSPERFQPSDKFHAGCENQIDIVFDLKGIYINGLNAILEYNSSQVEVLRIFVDGEKENNLSYIVEGNRIIFNKLKSDQNLLDRIVFKMYFKVSDSLKSSQFNFVKGSYIIDDKGNMVDIDQNFSFEFASVPECDPDIVSPTVDLIFPILGSGEYIALDSHFQFDIYDLGKGVNKDSIVVVIDGIRYDLYNLEHEWEGTTLTIYPDNWLSLDSEIKVLLMVADKQVYGRANLTTKEYSFYTSTGLNLLNEIDPVQFRKLVNKEKYYQGSKAECDWLRDNYVVSDTETKDIILSINKRLSCGNLDNLDDFVPKEKVEEKIGFSVFAILGWIISVILFSIIVFRWLSFDHKK